MPPRPNNYGLPESEVDRVRRRDQRCVYCGKQMADPSPAVFRGDWATIEHLNHLPPWTNPETIAICCGSCNSSRGAKTLTAWLASRYCRERGITLESVAAPVQCGVKAQHHDWRGESPAAGAARGTAVRREAEGRWNGRSDCERWAISPIRSAAIALLRDRSQPWCSASHGS